MTYGQLYDKHLNEMWGDKLEHTTVPDDSDILCEECRKGLKKVERITAKQARALKVMQRRSDWDRVIHANTTYSLIRRGLIEENIFGNHFPSEKGLAALEAFEAKQADKHWEYAC